ncbi:MAG: hypothetical protein ACFFCS_20210, partial [Candidatus Hodarchaeota archaeon]
MSENNEKDLSEEIEEKRNEKRVMETRDKFQELLESKNYQEAIKLSFQLIQDLDNVLIPDALDTIRQITVEEPEILNQSQVQVLINFMESDDDNIRYLAVIALKPVVLKIPDLAIELTSPFITLKKSSKSLEEAIRMLGHIGTSFPKKISQFIPDFVDLLKDPDTYVSNRSLKSLMILSKHYPNKIEKLLKKIIDEIEDNDLIGKIKELLVEIIKNRDLEITEDKGTEDDARKDELIPEMPDEGKEPSDEDTREPSSQKEPTTQEEQPSEEEIKKEIGAKIEEEFSKIEEGDKPDEPSLSELKEIKTEKDLASEPSPKETIPEAKTPSITPKISPEVEKEKPSIETNEDLVKKQLLIKEKELQRREDELKKMELEKKELELQAKELELEREEMERAKLEKMEQELKSKERELKE